MLVNILLPCLIVFVLGTVDTNARRPKNLLKIGLKTYLVVQYIE